MKNKIVLLGYGTIGKCVLDVLLLDADHIRKQVGIDPLQAEIVVVDREIDVPSHLDYVNVRWMQKRLNKKSLRDLFDDISLKQRDIVIDLTSCTGTRDIVKQVAAVRGANYINTAMEGWNGWMYEMPKMIKHAETLRELLPRGTATALLTHGMNPGMASHFAMLGVEMFRAIGIHPRNIAIVHITEIDTQRMVHKRRKGNKNNATDLIDGLPLAVPRLTVNRPSMPRNIVSTWGPQNFADEMNATPTFVDRGMPTKTRRRAYRTLVPSMIYDPDKRTLIPFCGHLVTHEETFTINNHLKMRYGTRADIAFVYKPTDVSLKSLIEKGCRLKPGQRKGFLLKGKNVVGYDTVGVYMESIDGKGLWIGNACETGHAVNGRLAEKHHNATTMQVTAGVMGGLFAIVRSPRLGFCYPEEISFKLRRDMLKFVERYIGKIHCFYT